MFAFKQFTIQQDRTAMKVCTDACVLGAYAHVGLGGRILDIGTGTGLLALMAAQRNPTAVIDAVELDDAAFGQASENIRSSPFANRVQAVHQRIQEFIPREPYARILTNPPFYTHHLRSPDRAVNRALHTDELPVQELIEAVVRLLNQTGQWWVLLPPYETGTLTELAAEAGLHPFRRLSVRHQAKKPVFRLVTGFAFEAAALVDEILTIYEADGKTYTAEFQQLLRNFYLNF